MLVYLHDAVKPPIMLTKKKQHFFLLCIYFLGKEIFFLKNKIIWVWNPYVKLCVITSESWKFTKKNGHPCIVSIVTSKNFIKLADFRVLPVRVSYEYWLKIMRKLIFVSGAIKKCYVSHSVGQKQVCSLSWNARCKSMPTLTGSKLSHSSVSKSTGIKYWETYQTSDCSFL